MAEIKITQLPETASSEPSDYFMIVQNGINKKMSLATLLKTLDSSDTIRINPARNIIDIQISAANAPYMIYVNSSSSFVGINTDTPQSTLHVLGNVQAGSSAHDGILIHSSESITYTTAGDSVQGVGWWKPLNAARDTSAITVEAGAGNGQFDLGNGLPGQYKTITAASLPAATKGIIRVQAGLGFNRIDLTTNGYSVVLKCVNIGGFPKWVCVGSYLAILYTV